MTTLGGGTAISGGGTPDTGGGTPFRPVPAEFNHCVNYYFSRLCCCRVKLSLAKVGSVLFNEWTMLDCLKLLLVSVLKQAIYGVAQLAHYYVLLFRVFVAVYQINKPNKNNSITRRCRARWPLRRAALPDYRQISQKTKHFGW